VVEDLAEALNAGRIAGAGLMFRRTPAADNPLLRAKNWSSRPMAWAVRRRGND
jgi:phosphoglycerate dehydrogenase-like enzyme